MPCCGHAPGSRVERKDPGKRGRLADGPAAVAAETSCGKTRGNSRCFTSTRSASRPMNIPGIVCLSIKQIVRLIRHQELRAVCCAQNHCASKAETSHSFSIVLRNLSAMEHAANLTLISLRRY